MRFDPKEHSAIAFYSLLRRREEGGVGLQQRRGEQSSEGTVEQVSKRQQPDRTTAHRLLTLTTLSSFPSHSPLRVRFVRLAVQRESEGRSVSLPLFPFAPPSPTRIEKRRTRSRASSSASSTLPPTTTASQHQRNSLCTTIYRQQEAHTPSEPTPTLEACDDEALAAMSVEAESAVPSGSTSSSSATGGTQLRASAKPFTFNPNAKSFSWAPTAPKPVVQVRVAGQRGAGRENGRRVPCHAPSSCSALQQKD